MPLSHISKILFNKVKANFGILFVLFSTGALLMPTLGKYYGFYYDNHPYNLLALDLMDEFRLIFYMNGYTIHSSFFSYLLYPLFKIFGPSDFSAGLLCVLLHLCTIFVCFKLGERLFNRIFGLIFAYLAAIAPLYIINIYTWQFYSFICFLNIAAVYYFTIGMEDESVAKVTAGSLLYSLSCIHAIYSLLLFPFFVIFAFIHLVLFKDKRCAENKPRGRFFYAKKFFLIPGFFMLATVSFIYLALIIGTMFFAHYKMVYYSVTGIILISVFLIYKKINAGFRRVLKFYSLFFLILTAVLLLLEVFLQLDANFFNQKFLYYRDDYAIGGFSHIRPEFIFAGRAVKLFGRQIYLAFLSPLLVLRADYTGLYLNLLDTIRMMFSYYKNCFPLGIIVFFIFGIAGLLIDILYRGLKKEGLTFSHIFCLSWLFGVTASFINLNPRHMFRIAVMPMPYFFSALGVYYVGRIMKYIFEWGKRPFIISIIVIVSFLSFKQLHFLKDNIFEKYRRDKTSSNYFFLFNGWSYGRSYKEVGDFLLSDAPLKKDGKFRSIFIYTIAPDVPIGICSIFYNSINWYTQNKIKIIYDFKPVSEAKYGLGESLKKYLNQLFFENPDVEAIYFADFYDTKSNYSFFSRVHPDITPYKIVNDDGNLDYDCILYKFQRNPGILYWERE